jgi:hypothetical protein
MYASGYTHTSHLCTHLEESHTEHWQTRLTLDSSSTRHRQRGVADNTDRWNLYECKCKYVSFEPGASTKFST